VDPLLWIICETMIWKWKLSRNTYTWLHSLPSTGIVLCDEDRTIVCLKEMYSATSGVYVYRRNRLLRTKAHTEFKHMYAQLMLAHDSRSLVPLKRMTSKYTSASGFKQATISTYI
jgi:hypothetical protein